MKFLWTMSSGGGGVPPQLALCESLAEVGHEVLAVVPERVAPSVEQSGLPVETFAEVSRPAGTTMAEVEEWVWSEQ